MIFFKLTLNTRPGIETISSGLGDEEIILKWMVTFYSRGPRRRGTLEHSNFKFGLDKTLSIPPESAEVGLLRSPLLIAFALGFAEPEVLVQNYSIAKEAATKASLFFFPFWREWAKGKKWRHCGFSAASLVLPAKDGRKHPDNEVQRPKSAIRSYLWIQNLTWLCFVLLIGWVDFCLCLFLVMEAIENRAQGC